MDLLLRDLAHLGAVFNPKHVVDTFLFPGCCINLISDAPSLSPAAIECIRSTPIVRECRHVGDGDVLLSVHVDTFGYWLGTRGDRYVTSYYILPANLFSWTASIQRTMLDRLVFMQTLPVIVRLLLGHPVVKLELTDDLDDSALPDVVYNLRINYGITPVEIRRVLIDSALFALPDALPCLRSCAAAGFLFPAAGLESPVQQWLHSQSEILLVRISSSPLETGVVRLRNGGLALLTRLWIARAGPWMIVVGPRSDDRDDFLPALSTGETTTVSEIVGPVDVTNVAFLRSDLMVLAWPKDNIFAPLIRLHWEQSKVVKPAPALLAAPNPDLPRIGLVIILIRTSNGQRKGEHLGSLWMQLLSILAFPPSLINPDWSNVDAIHVVIELCSSYAHPLRDRSSYLYHVSRMTPEDVLLVVNPDRLTRRLDDLALICGLNVHSTGISSDAWKASQWCSWRDQWDVVARHVEASIALAGQQGEYTKAGQAMTRLLLSATSDYVQVAKEGLRAWAERAGIVEWHIICRTSPDQKKAYGTNLQGNSVRRQRTLIDAFLPEDGRRRVIHELENLSAGTASDAILCQLRPRPPPASALLFATLDRLTRWPHLDQVLDHFVASQWHVFCISWPASLLRHVVAEPDATIPYPEHMLDSFRLQLPLASSPLALPFMRILHINPGVQSPTVEAAMREIARQNAAFSNGRSLSSYQGQPTTPPEWLKVGARGVSVEVAQRLEKYLIDKYGNARVNFYQRDAAFSCSCPPSQCPSDCRCGCAKCVAFRESLCPAFSLSTPCFATCVCKCAGHHVKQKDVVPDTEAPPPPTPPLRPRKPCATIDCPRQCAPNKGNYCPSCYKARSAAARAANGCRHCSGALTNPKTAFCSVPCYRAMCEREGKQPLECNKKRSENCRGFVLPGLAKTCDKCRK